MVNNVRMYEFHLVILFAVNVKIKHFLFVDLMREKIKYFL